MSQAFRLVPGTRFGVRPSVLGLRPGRRMRERSHLPCPPSLHGRGPDTEHRGPNGRGLPQHGAGY